MSSKYFFFSIYRRCGLIMAAILPASISRLRSLDQRLDMINDCITKKALTESENFESLKYLFEENYRKSIELSLVLKSEFLSVVSQNQKELSEVYSRLNQDLRAELLDELAKSKKELIGGYVRLNREVLKLPMRSWVEAFMYESIRSYEKSDRVACCVINDTRHEIGHFGCEIVMKNIEDAICEVGADLVCSVQSNLGLSVQLLDVLFNKVDVVFINGEGTMHSNRSAHLYRIASIAQARRKRVLLINSVWQRNDKYIHALRLFDRIYLREPKSYREAIRDGAQNVEVMADMTFYAPRQRAEHPCREGLLKHVIITDSVNTDVARQLFVLSRVLDVTLHYMGASNPVEGWGEVSLISTAEQLSDASLIVTGRFHTAALAVNYGIPFLAIESNTHKISGLIEGVGIDPQVHMLAECPQTIEAFQCHVELFTDVNLEMYYDRTDCYVRENERRLSEFFEKAVHDV